MVILTRCWCLSCRHQSGCSRRPPCLVPDLVAVADPQLDPAAAGHAAAGFSAAGFRGRVSAASWRSSSIGIV